MLLHPHILNNKFNNLTFIRLTMRLVFIKEVLFKFYLILHRSRVTDLRIYQTEIVETNININYEYY